MPPDRKEAAEKLRQLVNSNSVPSLEEMQRAENT